MSPNSALPHNFVPPVVLKMQQVNALGRKELPALRDFSLEIHAGEIFGIAGSSANGQYELAQVLDGTRAVTSGKILLEGKDITLFDPGKKTNAGIGHIPENSTSHLVAEMSVEQNLVLDNLDAFRRFGFVNNRLIRQFAERIIESYRIKATPTDKISTLSGGTLQKIALARVLERQPKLIVVSQPTRGLDVSTSEYVWQKLREQRLQGAALLIISKDLEELFRLSDRIGVIRAGQICKILPPAEYDPVKILLLMTDMTAE